MRNIKKQNVKRNPRVTRSTAHRKAHPSSGRPKPIRSKKITRRPGARRGIHSSLPRAYAEVSPKAPPKAPPKVNPKVTRTHQVRHTTRNVQDVNALGRFTADVGHGARTTVESYNFINPQTRSLRESTLFEVGVGTLTGQYTPEQGWGEAGRRVTEQPGRVVGETAVEVGTALIPIGALFKATKIGSVVSKLIGKGGFSPPNPLKSDPLAARPALFTKPPPGGKGGSPRNYGDKLLKNTLVPVLEFHWDKPRYLNYLSTRRAAGWETPVATKAFREVIDYGVTKTTYTDNTASAIRSVKGSLAKSDGEDRRIFHVGSGVQDIAPDGHRPISPSELGWNPSGGKKFGSLVSPKEAKAPITRKKILPGLYKETEITPVGAFTEKTKVITTPPGKTTGSSKPPYAFTETGMKGPYSKYYTKFRKYYYYFFR